MIDCVVTNYKTPEDLGVFAWSFLRHAPADARLWIVNVDPGPGDEAMADALVTAAVGRIEALGTSENIGYGRACNWGAALGFDKVIAFFNADVELTAGALEQCAGALLARSDWGFLGPRQVDSTNRLTAAGIFGTPASPKHRGWKEIDHGQYDDVRDDAVTVAGSALFVRRSVWNLLADCETFQPFNPHEPGALLPTSFYYEETAACYHALAHGFANVYFGPVRIVHKWHGAVKSERWAQEQMVDSQRSFRAFCDAHGMDHD